MTGDTRCPRSSGFVKMVFLRRKSRLCVTAVTDRIAREMKTEAVRIVAIAAGYAVLIHQTLCERAVDIDLILNLTIGKVEVALEQGRSMRVQDRSTKCVGAGNN